MNTRIFIAIAALSLAAPAFAQSSPETAPADKTGVPESARDPQDKVPETADDIDHTKKNRDEAAKRGAVRSNTPPKKTEPAAEGDKDAPPPK
jgi:hypothetical protein